jgi:diguanylate cyclase (GGDEF)-like protein/PAS domain S-box-containing protein
VIAKAEPVKVLIVDDNAADADLERMELRRAGLAVEHRVVGNERGLRSALREFKPDVILCDFWFPDFDGSAALQIAQEISPTTPLIFVSGTISEERAVIAVRSGAADYVLKSSLLRLPGAVLRAVEEAREKQRRRTAEDELEAAHERLASIFSSVDSALMSFSVPDERFIYVSPAAERIFGYAAEAFLRSPDLWSQVIAAEDRAAAEAAAKRLLPEGSYDVDYRVVQSEGIVRWVNHRAKLFRDRDGRPLRVDSVISDITERMEEQRQLLRLTRIRDVLSKVNSAILRTREPRELFDQACRIATSVGGFSFAYVVTVDPVARRGEIPALLGGPSRDGLERSLRSILDEPERAPGILALSLRSLRPVVLNDLERGSALAEHRDLVLEGVRAAGSFPFTIERSTVGALVLGTREAGFFNEEEIELVGNLTNNLSVALDAGAKQRLVDHLSYFDPLTQLANRPLCQARLAQEIAAVKRRGGKLAFIVLDISRFSVLNSTFGERAGDELLRGLGARLRSEIGDSSVARIGGNRFALMFDDLGDVPNVLDEHGVRFLEAPFSIDGAELRVTARAGCAIFPDDGDDAGSIFRNAEAALQSAKTSEKAYRFYSPEVAAQLAQRLDLEARLRRAVKTGQFVLHYQPKVELHTRKLVGLEALIRWQDPNDALVLPGRFIPVLEETGLIVPVGRWVIVEAARQQRAWRRDGFRPPRISVNVSAVQFRENHLLEEVRKASDSSPGECELEFEITESVLMGNDVAAAASLRSIRDLGVEISIDDFGTGYSSLSRLHSLPISTLKIDRSFIDGMTDDVNKTEIVSTIISLAQTLRLKVIAEGVETEQQAKLLQSLRCDEIQGFLVARPMPPDEVAEWLQASP